MTSPWAWPPATPPSQSTSGSTDALETTGAPVNVSNAAPPVFGQVLTALDATHSQWRVPGLHYDPAIRFNIDATGTATIEPNTWGLCQTAPAGSTGVTVVVVSSLTAPPVDSRFGLYVSATLTAPVTVTLLGASQIMGLDGTLGSSCVLRPGASYEWVFYHEGGVAIWGLVSDTANLARGWKQPCRAYYTASTFDALTQAPNVVDGVTLALGDRVLATVISGPSLTGIYAVVTLGTGANGRWQFVEPVNQGDVVLVSEGSITYARTLWTFNGIGLETIPEVVTSQRDGLMSLSDKTLFDGTVLPQLPSSGQKAALAGSSGTPSASNKYVTESDPRVSRDKIMVYLNTAANTHGTSTFAKVPLDTVYFDTNGLWDATNKRIVPKKAGYYLVTGRLRTNTPGASTAAATLNTNVASQALGGDVGTANQAVGGTTLMYCNGTTDYLELFTYSATVRAYTVGLFDTYMNVVGPL